MFVGLEQSKVVCTDTINKRARHGWARIPAFGSGGRQEDGELQASLGYTEDTV
jgi:hypothetical protein